jgi:uncharacterized membrane protein
MSNCAPHNTPHAKPVDSKYQKLAAQALGPSDFEIRPNNPKETLMTDLAALGHQIQEGEEQLLKKLRTLRRKTRGGSESSSDVLPLTAGQRIADTVAATMGSWNFIIIQSVILIVWIVLNLVAFIQHWDPYPFILLNLALSFQAAYAAPFIMMSQNRQQDIDRQAAENDYHINVKAELEIELLHQKIDQLRETEVLHLTEVVHQLADMLKKAEERGV